MPIYESCGSTVCEFGHGDILMSEGTHPEMSYPNEISLIPDDRRNPVGETIDPARWEAEFAGKNSEELKVPVRLAFANVAGLDALVQTLLELRAKIAEARRTGATH